MNVALNDCKVSTLGLITAGLLVAGLMLAVCVPVASARVLTVEVDRIQTPVASLQDVELKLDWPPDALSGTLSLTAKSLDASEFGYRWQRLDWRCTLKRQAKAWQCQGPIKARSVSGMSLSARWESDAIVIEALQSDARLRVRSDLATDAGLRLELVQLPATWLAPMLATVWPEGHPTAGTLDLDWRVRSEAKGVRVAGPVIVSNLGVDSRDGSIAAADVRAAGQIKAALDDASTTLELDMTLGGGEFLYGPMYVVLPKAEVAVAAKLSSSTAQQWHVEGLRWNDVGVLELQGSMDLDLSATMPLRAADLDADLPGLTMVQTRYFDSLASSFGMKNLSLDGAARARVAWRDGRWQTVDLSLHKVAVRDGGQRFSGEGLDGNVRLQRSEAALDSELAWAKAQFYGLTLGAARLPIRSAGAGVSVRSAVNIPFLDGHLRLNSLAYAPTSQDARFDMSLGLDQVNLAALGTALGWPAFDGSISGELPGVHYLDGRLDFEGGLVAQVFDGRLNVSQLSMERAFGVAPMLAASIEFSELDLAPLTRAFGFGEITGRLDGHIRDLRLLDWQPVAFNAAFNTVKRSGVKRRISQRAVRDLTEVGGGGIAAGLQNQALKVFSDFGYARIGLSCVLADDVCTMGGVGPAAKGGYAIVEGSGLPQVNVIGHQQRVDWPVLVARLKAATEGQRPVID